MTNDLFFSQTLFRQPSSSIPRSETEFCARAQASKSKAIYKPKESKSDNFLSTLKKVSQNKNRAGEPSVSERAKSSRTQELKSIDKIEAKFDSAVEPDERTSDCTSIQETGKAKEAIQNPLFWDFMVFRDALEKQGLYDSNGGSDVNIGDGLSVIKTLINGVQNSDFELPTELTAQLERLGQIIANQSAGAPLSQTIANPISSFSLNQMVDRTDIEQLLQSVFRELVSKKGDFSLYSGEKADSAKTLDMISAMMKIVADSSENASFLENREKTDTLKMSGEIRTSMSEVIENSKKMKSLEMAPADASKPEDNSDASGKTRASNGAGYLNKIPSAFQYRGEADQDRQLNNESSPVAKMVNEAQLTKKNQVRFDAVVSDESGGKVTKVDTGYHDHGLLNSHNQTAEKTWGATSSSTETGRDLLTTQTLDQIVKKAVIQLRNGQHQAKIDLKPDFLGHIRMQVTAENHQVNVKILAELPFVKEIIENNLHQLKADLQQNGLTVDKLEVAVSTDSDENKNPQEKAHRSKTRQQGMDSDTTDNSKEETRKQTRRSGKSVNDSPAVDYFA